MPVHIAVAPKLRTGVHASLEARSVWVRLHVLESTGCARCKQTSCLLRCWNVGTAAAAGTTGAAASGLATAPQPGQPATAVPGAAPAGLHRASTLEPGLDAHAESYGAVDGISAFGDVLERQRGSQGAGPGPGGAKALNLRRMRLYATAAPAAVEAAEDVAQPARGRKGRGPAARQGSMSYDALNEVRCGPGWGSAWHGVRWATHRIT